MCKKPIQIDGLHSCLGEEGAGARFDTYLTHSKQDTRYNASHDYFVSNGATRLCFFFLFYFIMLLSLLILILKIGIKSFYSYMTLFCELVEFYHFALRF